jgi:uncharacterized phage protein (TIGR02218 family)
MSGFSQDFLAHLEGGATTVCHCWRLTRRDGVVLGFTDHDRMLTVDGLDYEPRSGLTASETRTTVGLTPDASDVEGALSSDAISEADIAAGRYDGARVDAFLVNWADVSQFALLRTATFGAITRADGHFKVELEGLAAALDRPMGRIYRKTCDAALGDGRCRFDLETAGCSGSGALVAVRGGGKLAVSGLNAFAAGWFEHGKLTWTDGALAGTSLQVTGHEIVGGEVVLAVNGDIGPEPAVAAFTIIAGCDKRFATCKAKFANQLNFQGFPHMPGNDAAYAYVRDGVEFDGGALVP